MQAFNALVVEGTSGVGKSTLIDALIRKHTNSVEPRKIRSFLHLAQSHTYGPLAQGEDAGTLTVAENAAHLERIVAMLEWLHASVQEHSKPSCFVIVDALHLTHCVRPGVATWDAVRTIDQHLAALGTKLLFLKASPDTIWSRGIQPRTNEQFMLEYARKFGRTDQQIHNYFVQEQGLLCELFSRSVMPKLLLDNDGLVEDVLEKAFQFWIGSPQSARAAPW
jgi:thymidylate kinase